MNIRLYKIYEEIVMYCKNLDHYSFVCKWTPEEKEVIEYASERRDIAEEELKRILASLSKEDQEVVFEKAYELRTLENSGLFKDVLKVKWQENMSASALQTIISLK